MMKESTLLFIIVAICLNSAIVGDTLWQRDWYRGDGQLSAADEWNYQYWRTESLNTENHYITYMAKRQEYDAWVKHVVDSGSRICPFSRKMPVDFDKDGDLDIVGIKQGDDLVFWENIDDWVFEESTLIDMPYLARGICAYRNDVHPVDLDFDGDYDVMVVSDSGAFIVVNHGNSYEKLVIDRSRGYHTIDVARVTDSTHMAVLISTIFSADPVGNRGHAYVFVIDKDISFTRTYLYRPPSPEGWRVMTADFDQDGYPDWTHDYPTFRILLNRSGAECDSFESVFTVGVATDGLYVQDFDSDGDLDVCTSIINRFYLAKNLLMETGTCSFAWETLGDVAGLGDGAQAVDIDLDGTCDIISSFAYIGYLRYDAGAFTPYTIYNPGGNLNSHWIIAGNFGGSDCDVDVDILAAWNGHFAIFENQMLTFTSSGWLESSVLDLPSDMTPTAFGWYDCIPDSFDIHYFVRSGASVRECTTAVWERVWSSGDSVSGVHGGCFQYRIEFLSNNGPKDQSPRVDSVFLVCTECTVSVDSVWFWEDTLCNDSNIVTICYDLTCDSADISVEMSANAGTTWSVPLNTLLDTAGNLGVGVPPGEHCFRWVMSEDYYGHEHCRFMVNISANWWEDDICTLVDTFNVASLEGVAGITGGLPTGLAMLDSSLAFAQSGDNPSIYIVNGDIDSIERVLLDPGYPETWQDLAYDGQFLYALEYFDVKVYKLDPLTGAIIATSGVNPGERGDGLAYDPIHDCLWITGHGWFLNKLDPNTLELIDSYHLQQFDSTSSPNPEGLTMAYGKLFVVSDPHGKIGWLDLDNIRNDTVIFINKCTLPGWDQAPEGLAFDGQHILYANSYNHTVYAIGNYSDTVDAVSYIDCLDSRLPQVTLSLPEATCVNAGEELIWSIEDLFWADDPCTLYVSGCGIEERHIISDTHFTWTAPARPCSSITVIIAARDSFCNWGRDTVHISVSSGPIAEVIRPAPCGDITSCEDQNIIIHIWDTTGHAIFDSSIILGIAGESYDITAPELSWNHSEGLLIFEPSVPWENEQTIQFELINYTNTADCPGEPISCSFVVDIEALTYEFSSHNNGDIIHTLQPEMIFNITDNLSGIDSTTIELTINGYTYDLSDVIWMSEAELAGQIIFRPEAIPIKYAPGDTLYINLAACDSPDYDYCQPNCSDSTWILIIELQALCKVHPNPFTPNNDDINDITVFDYPTMFSQDAELHIYTLRNVEVWSGRIGPVVSFEEYLKRDWNGFDDKSKPLPEGLYLYVIMRDGKVICNGTVTLER